MDCNMSDTGRGAPSPEQKRFLDVGVGHGGDYGQLARGLQNYRMGTLRETIYKVGSTGLELNMYQT